MPKRWNPLLQTQDLFKKKSLGWVGWLRGGELFMVLKSHGKLNNLSTRRRLWLSQFKDESDLPVGRTHRWVWRSLGDPVIKWKSTANRWNPLLEIYFKKSLRWLRGGELFMVLKSHGRLNNLSNDVGPYAVEDFGCLNSRTNLTCR